MSGILMSPEVERAALHGFIHFHCSDTKQASRVLVFISISGIYHGLPHSCYTTHERFSLSLPNPAFTPFICLQQYARFRLFFLPLNRIVFYNRHLHSLLRFMYIFLPGMLTLFYFFYYWQEER